MLALHRIYPVSYTHLSNDTPAEDYVLAEKLGAIINLDDFTHIDFLEKTIGYIPETISCRYNPGGLFKISNDIMDNPGDALSLIHILLRADER